MSARCVWLAAAAAAWPLLAAAQPSPAAAQMAMGMDGGAAIGMLTIDQLESTHSNDGAGARWDAQASYGGDLDKLWLRTEGDHGRGRLESGDLELLWSHAIAAYWNSQLGLRDDFGVGPGRDWIALGVQGLAPYFVDLEATAYLGPSGRSAARLRAQYDLLLTQRLILRPELETNLYGRSDPRRRLGSGLADADFALRLRYEIRREFAPYLGVRWVHRFGATASFARADGAAATERQWVAGLRLWF